mgnify:CR=1 FL=1
MHSRHARHGRDIVGLIASGATAEEIRSVISAAREARAIAIGHYALIVLIKASGLSIVPPMYMTGAAERPRAIG